MMDIEIITLVMLGLLGLFLLMGIPLAFCTGLIAMGVGLVTVGPVSLQLIASRWYNFTQEYALTAVPLFIFMASLLDQSGIARDLYNAIRVWAGRIRGGVGIMTLFVAVILASLTGIAGSEIVLLGLVAMPQMLRLGYDKKMTIGIVVAGGSLGTQIPPSIVLIMYGLITGTSIGDLFLATVFPGLLLASFYILYVLVRCNLNPAMGPPLPKEDRVENFWEKVKLLKGVILPILVAFFMLGSIYTGVASITEAAGMGVVGTLFSIIYRRELTLDIIRHALYQTMTTCGTLIWLCIGATALVGLYNYLGGNQFVHGFITSLDLPSIGVILMMMAILLVLGMFMDWIGIAMLTMPIFVPIIVSFGYDPVWFGILFAMNMQVSFISPPFGPSAFYLKGVAPPDIRLEDIFNSMWPFIIMQIISLGILITWPQIALWLPKMVYGS
jgi:tripartite ATP-independent transporter DctM subunit